MTQSTHRRSPSSPHTSKQKLPRPGLHRRGTSAVNVSISKLGSGIGHSRASSKVDDDVEVAMASFLNFCATCEKQIVYPDNYRLYCSESCRLKDSEKPLSAANPSGSTLSSTTSNRKSSTTSSTISPSTSTSPATTSSTTTSTAKPRDIVAPMKPTSRTSMIRKPNTSFDGSADMDPTEWKPALNRSATSLGSSDAWAYLSTFYGSESLPTRRNRSIASLPGRIETAEAHTHENMPALTHTPSTPDSSFSSDSSVEIMDEVTITLNDIKRSLPTRTKGADLVTPLEKSVPVVVVDGPDVWENPRDAHHHHSPSAPIPIGVRAAPHVRMRTA